MRFAALLLATVFLAYTNGSNDNFKGVATFFGSDAQRKWLLLADSRRLSDLGTALPIVHFSPDGGPKFHE